MQGKPHNPRPVTAAELEGDLIPAGHPLYRTVWVNPERLGGEPCFFGTRVPIKNLFDYLKGGHSIEGFLADFPGVTREQVETVLTRALASLSALGNAA